MELKWLQALIFSGICADTLEAGSAEKVYRISSNVFNVKVKLLILEATASPYVKYLRKLMK